MHVKTASEIGPPDSFYLSAAAGWLELGNAAEAQDELRRISPHFNDHPDVLDVQWTIHADRKDWIGCVDAATALVRIAPERPAGWIHRSFALHELKRTQEAWDALVPVAETFSREYLIAYNLACYAAQLERKNEAWQWLRRAIDIAGVEKIKLMALKDADLKLLWTEIEDL